MMQESQQSRHAKQEQESYLIQYLRYGSETDTQHERVWLSMANIARILQVPYTRVRQVLHPGLDEVVDVRPAKKKRSVQFSNQQKDYLTSHAVLESWACLTLRQRVAKLKQQYPDEYHSLRQLRGLYRERLVRLRPVGISVAKTVKQHSNIVKAKLAAFPQVLSLLSAGQEVIFVDEAVFTHSQNSLNTWQGKHQKIMAPKKQVGFTAIAVIAGININGEIVAMLMAEKSIKVPEIVAFLRQVSRRRRFDNVAIYWDNLRGHYSADTVAELERQQADVIYAPAYSSEYNCVERLWAYGKRIFRKKCLLECDYSSQEKLMLLVKQSLYAVTRESLQNNAVSCLNAMQRELVRLGSDHTYQDSRQLLRSFVE